MRKAVLISTAVAVALAAWYLAAAPMGTDLSAQVARADFIREHGFTPLDLRWYAGTNQFGYSLISPIIMSVIGAKWLGAISAVASSTGLAYLLARGHARRPVAAGVAGAVCMVGDIVSGRTTFALGVAFGIGALALIATPGLATWWRRPLIGVLGLLSTLASPVAGLFAGLAAVAVLLADARVKDYRPYLGWDGPDAITLAIGAAIGLAPSLMFADGGVQPFSADALRTNVAIAVALFFLVPARLRAVRIGAVLSIAMLAFALYVPSAIGSNAMRLTMLFGVPVIIAYANLNRWLLTGMVAAMVWWQNPIMLNDIRHGGSPETKASFYRPLLGELKSLQPLGRIEVVPLRDHWESKYVADQVPLARGWERQVDTVRNPIFYDANALTVPHYGVWLRDNAVQYVAVSDTAPLDVYGKGEAEIISERPYYLKLIWRTVDWSLYQVVRPDAFVSPGKLTESTADHVTFTTQVTGRVRVKLAWSKYLTVNAPACVEPSGDGWTTVLVPTGGTYTVTSTLTGNRRC